MWCYQNTLGKRQITCSWAANPIAPFYEIVFTNLEGLNNFTKSVSEVFVSEELDTPMGNIIGISVNNAVTKIMLMGTSTIIFFTTLAFSGLTLLPCFNYG